MRAQVHLIPVSHLAMEDECDIAASSLRVDLCQSTR